MVKNDLRTVGFETEKAHYRATTVSPLSVELPSTATKVCNVTHNGAIQVLTILLLLWKNRCQQLVSKCLLKLRQMTYFHRRKIKRKKKK